MKLMYLLGKFNISVSDNMELYNRLYNINKTNVFDIDKSNWDNDKIIIEKLIYSMNIVGDHYRIWSIF